MGNIVAHFFALIFAKKVSENFHNPPTLKSYGGQRRLISLPENYFV